MKHFTLRIIPKLNKLYFRYKKKKSSVRCLCNLTRHLLVPLVRMLQIWARSSSVQRITVTRCPRAAVGARGQDGGTAGSLWRLRAGSLCSCVNRTRRGGSGWRPSELSSPSPWLQRTMLVQWFPHRWNNGHSVFMLKYEPHAWYLSLFLRRWSCFETRKMMGTFWLNCLQWPAELQLIDVYFIYCMRLTHKNSRLHYFVY